MSTDIEQAVKAYDNIGKYLLNMRADEFIDTMFPDAVEYYKEEKLEAFVKDRLAFFFQLDSDYQKKIARLTKEKYGSLIE